MTVSISAVSINIDDCTIRRIECTAFFGNSKKFTHKNYLLVAAAGAGRPNLSRILKSYLLVLPNDSGDVTLSLTMYRYISSFRFGFLPFHQDIKSSKQLESVVKIDTMH